MGYETAGGVLLLISAGNLLLAIFNLFPGYPLDGGRVLRAIFWRRTGDIREATRLAGICGMLIAAILIIFGVYMIIAPNFRSYFMGLWSVLVGLFLFDAAYGVVKHARVHLQHVVGEAMSAPFSIEPDLLISSLIDSVLPLHRQVAFPVAQDRRLHGMSVHLEDLEIFAARTLASHTRLRCDATDWTAFLCRAERHARLRAGVDEAEWHWVACSGRKERRTRRLSSERHVQTLKKRTREAKQ